MQPTLTVWTFDSADGAETAAERLGGLEQQELVTVQDGAIVSWNDGDRKPKTRQLNSTAGEGALWGGFWGLLFGLIFFVPILGTVFGVALGALTGALTDVGIDDNFIASVRDKVTPGTSALFLMTTDAVPDRVAEAMSGSGMHLLTSNLPTADEETLRDLFAND